MKALHNVTQCPHCEYLGQNDKYNYYYHNNKSSNLYSLLVINKESIIVVHASVGSGDLKATNLIMTNPLLNKALQLAINQNLITDDIKEKFLKIQNNWLETHDKDDKHLTKLWEDLNRFLIK